MSCVYKEYEIKKKCTGAMTAVENEVFIGLGEGKLIFRCTGLTDSNFRQTKIKIILISYINISFITIFNSFNMIFFFSITIKYTKNRNKNLVHLTLLNLEVISFRGRFHL